MCITTIENYLNLYNFTYFNLWQSGNQSYYSIFLFGNDLNNLSNPY